MTTLVLYLVTGLIIREPITATDCRDLIAIARFADATGRYLSRDEGIIAALKCDDQAVVMMLPAATGDCEMEASS